MLFGLRLRWGDLVVVGLFIALGLGGLIYNFYFHEEYAQKYVEVYVANELVKEISLDHSDERVYQIPFQAQGETHHAEVEVKDGQVRMLPMSDDLCPRGICAHTGWISSEWETIVCAPNEIVVTFTETSEDEENDLDGVTY